MSIFLIKNHLKISNEIIILLFHKINKKTLNFYKKLMIHHSEIPIKC